MDFERTYREDADPWGIGSADSERYDAYRSLMLEHATERGSVLDIGCGLGAFLERFDGEFGESFGVDVSREAIRRGTALHRNIKFYVGSAPSLESVAELDRQFDAIIFSDVINYFNDRDKTRALGWIRSHLTADGVALIAAWSPGGKYLDRQEFRDLVSRQFVIDQVLSLDTGHVAFVARAKRFLMALTVDYETWQPVPPGKSIDWDSDVFNPCDRLRQICDGLEIRMTVMAELGEYFWLCENDSAVARKMEDQWRELIRSGHDVQVHLHPSWLPETGAKRTATGWYWDARFSLADRYPGDLTEVLQRCRTALEGLLQPVRRSYRATCFRAGAYQVEPFARLYAALVESGYECDTSVWRGGYSNERGYDFTNAYSSGQPYYPSPTNASLKALPVETSMMELPIWTPRDGVRWLFDGLRPELHRFVAEHMRDSVDAPPSLRRIRLEKSLRKTALRLYFGPLRHVRRILNRIVPRRLLHQLNTYGPDDQGHHQYFVMIGHTKVEHDYERLERELRSICQDARIESVRLSEMAEIAKADYSRRRRESAADEAAFQVEREYATVLGGSHNDAQAHRLQQMVPLDAATILDLGCGAGQWAAKLAQERPWAKVTGVDVGAEFIEAARRRYASASVDFVVGDFLALPLPDSSIECVYADNSLEHTFDLDKTLNEVMRVLIPGGSLVAAIPSDGRNPVRSVDNHTWKTIPSDVAVRLAAVGYHGISLTEIDLLRQMSMPPYAPSRDMMMYVTAMKPLPTDDGLGLSRRLVDWTYNHLDLSRDVSSTVPIDIVRGGHAGSEGSALVLAHILQQRALDASVVSMVATDHLRGRGPSKTETHSVVVARLDYGEIVLDPTCDTIISHPLTSILAQPRLALPKSSPDERYLSRQYELYDTAYWYSRVTEYTIDGKAVKTARSSTWTNSDDS